LGGTIAFEMAKQLQSLGKKVVILALFDTQAVEKKKQGTASIKHLPAVLKRYSSKALLKVNFELFLLRKHTRQAIIYKLKKIKTLLGSRQLVEDKAFDVFEKMSQAFQRASLNYHMKPYDGDLLVFYAKRHYYFMDRANKVIYKEINYNPNIKNAWRRYAREVKIYEIDGEHSTIFHPLHAKEFARILQKHLNKRSAI
jgi:thioesterase domain-containing protein